MNLHGIGYSFRLFLNFLLNFMLFMLLKEGASGGEVMMLVDSDEIALFG
jgi:hypothetical protein